MFCTIINAEVVDCSYCDRYYTCWGPNEHHDDDDDYYDYDRGYMARLTRSEARRLEDEDRMYERGEDRSRPRKGKGRNRQKVLDIPADFE